MKRPAFLRLVLAVVASLTMSSAISQGYPNRPVRIVIPFPPGGTLDALGRALAQKVGDQMGQPFVVENRPGGNGIIGGDAVAKAPPDGYTLLFNASTFVTAPMTMKEVPYGIEKDFVPISLVADYPMLVLVNKSHPAQTIAELVTWLKANPDKANYPTPSPVFTLPIEHFKIKTGAPATAISYRSSNESITSLLGGQTAFAFVETPVSVPQVATGNLRALAVTLPERIPDLPDVPTLTEAGVTDVVAGTWLALMAPAGTPMSIVRKLEAACRQIAATDDFKARMKALSSQSIGSTSDELAARMKAEVQRWSGVVKAANIKFEL